MTIIASFIASLIQFPCLLCSFSQTLMEMGFAENEVEDALRLHNNNQSAACDWLLGDRSNRLSTNPDSSAAAVSGLDVESSLYEAIMTNPIVQQGLNNTRCLHAFLSMLENPPATTHYLNDTEVKSCYFKSKNCMRYIFCV